jgi:hypothetical protein
VMPTRLPLRPMNRPTALVQTIEGGRATAWPCPDRREARPRHWHRFPRGRRPRRRDDAGARHGGHPLTRVRAARTPPVSRRRGRRRRPGRCCRPPAVVVGRSGGAAARRGASVCKLGQTHDAAVGGG